MTAQTTTAAGHGAIKCTLCQATKLTHVNVWTCLWLIYARVELKEKTDLSYGVRGRGRGGGGWWVLSRDFPRSLVHLGVCRKGPLTLGKGASTGIVVRVMAVINLTSATEQMLPVKPWACRDAQ